MHCPQVRTSGSTTGNQLQLRCNSATSAGIRPQSVRKTNGRGEML